MLRTITQRRWRLSEALSAAELAPRVSLYAPLAPPPDPQSLPHVRWRARDAFHASALLAAVADTATLPYRLDPGAPARPLGEPMGACDLHSLAQLLVWHVFKWLLLTKLSAQDILCT